MTLPAWSFDLKIFQKGKFIVSFRSEISSRDGNAHESRIKFAKSTKTVLLFEKRRSSVEYHISMLFGWDRTKKKNATWKQKRKFRMKFCSENVLLPSVHDYIITIVFSLLQNTKKYPPCFTQSFHSKMNAFENGKIFHVGRVCVYVCLCYVWT